MAGTIYQNIAISKITPILSTRPASDVAEVIAGTSNPVFQGLPAVTQAKVVVEIISAMSTVWALLIAGMALSFILSLFLGVGPQFPTHVIKTLLIFSIAKETLHGGWTTSCLDAS